MWKMHKLFSVLYFFGIYGCIAQSLQLQGQVTDENGEPLPFANIYLENTSIGTHSDANGGYQLSLETAGTYRLICSMIGFESTSSLVKVSTVDNGNIYNFKLKVDVQALETVTIDIKRDNKWKRQYQKFSKYFLGTDEYNFHSRCTIQNPYVLEFEEISGNLIAKATRPLIVSNPSLGYEIKYELSSFLLNKINGIVRYEGYIFFEELNPQNSEVARRWETNRKRSYLGSKMHFLRAISSNQLDAEGFMMYNERIPFEKLKIEKSSTDRLVTPESIIRKKDDATSELHFPGFMRVEYRHKQKEVYDNKYRHTINETSWLKLQIQNTPVDHKGALIRPMDVWFYEAMGIEAISRQLPINYSPDDEVSVIDTKEVFRTNLKLYDSLYQKEYVFLDLKKDLELTPGQPVSFNAYLFSGKYFELGSPSRVLYVELISPDCELISKTKVNISEGIAKGKLLVPATLYSGNYEIRAFTRWMKNFELEGSFSYRFNLSRSSHNPEASKVEIIPEYGKIFNKIKNNIHFRTLDEIDSPTSAYVRLFNEKEELMVDFTTDSLGFHLLKDFKPKSEESYHVLVNGSMRKWNLPISNEATVDFQVKEEETGLKVLVTNNGAYAEFFLLVESYGLLSHHEHFVLDKKEKFTYFIEKRNLRHGINDISLLDRQFVSLGQKRIFHRPNSLNGFSPEFLDSETSIQQYVLADEMKFPIENMARRTLDYSVIFAENFHEPKYVFEKGFQLTGKVKRPQDNSKSKEMGGNLQLLVRSSLPQIFKTAVEKDGYFMFDQVIYDDTTDLLIDYEDTEIGELVIEFDTTAYVYDPSQIAGCNGIKDKVEYVSAGSDFITLNEATSLRTVEITSKRSREDAVEEREAIYGKPDWSVNLYENADQRQLMQAGVLEYLVGRVPNGRVLRDKYANPVGFTLRGIDSFLGGVSAIFIFDGLTISAEDFNRLDPYSIGRVDVLSGPAAASFGARGATGVVIAYPRKGQGISGPTSVKTFNLPGGFDVYSFESRKN